jgi:hypothetical protein
MPLNLDDLAAGEGFRLDAQVTAVAGGGDVNGDGFADVVFGAQFAGPTVHGSYYGIPYEAPSWTGEAYVVFGDSDAPPLVIAPDDLTGANGFTIAGAQNAAYTGTSVGAAGDVNGDGFGDLIIGAPGEGKVTFRYDYQRFESNGVGAAYVVFGSASPVAAKLELATLADDAGQKLTGADFYDKTGRAVSGIGDLNGDGFDDFAIGAPEVGPVLGGHGTVYTSNTGATYVVFGDGTATPPPLRPDQLTGSNGFVLTAPLPRPDQYNHSAYSFLLGQSVAGAGDVNGDGLADLIVGAPAAGHGSDNYAGAAYVVFGSTQGFAAQLAIGDLDGTNGFAIPGITQGNQLGTAVAGAGDFNADGIDDLLLADDDRAYVIYGRAGGFAASLDLTMLDASTGVVLTAGWRLASVAGLGDVNGDGIDDIALAENRFGPEPARAYVVLGRAGGLGASVDLGLLSQANGLIVEGGEGPVAGLGDVNGDGYADFAIGAQVVFGGPELFTLPVIRGTAGPDVLLGTPKAEEILGLAGGDTLSGGGGSDVLRGGSGNDTLDGGEGSDALYGGTGHDTLTGGAGKDRVEGGDGNDVITVAGGADDVFGGTGDDTIRVATSADVGSSSFDGGDGFDRLVAIGGIGLNVDLAGSNLEWVRGTDANDQISGVETIFGGGGRDTLRGRWLDGGDGSDRLFSGRDGWVTGGAGNDVVFGGRGHQQIAGGDGNDTLHASHEDDVVRGGDGNDRITNGSGIDKLFGDAGDDRLSGGRDRDWLYGGGGDDRLAGAKGPDFFVYAKPAGGGDLGQDVITDFTEGRDLIRLVGYTAAEVTIDNTAHAITLADGTSVTLANFNGTIDQSDLLFV